MPAEFRRPLAAAVGPENQKTSETDPTPLRDPLFPNQLLFPCGFIVRGWILIVDAGFGVRGSLESQVPSSLSF